MSMKKKSFRAQSYALKGDAFVIADYNRVRPMASFFPGIAGLFGTPLWVFYVNRGQAITGVGIRSKDEAIMEFLPANRAYQMVSTQGFRTFVKIRRGRQNFLYEPFSSGAAESWVTNRMEIRPHELVLWEQNKKLMLETEVVYFTVPHESYGALARQMTVRNTGRAVQTVEILDGASVVFPYGINNWFLKEMSRTIEAWMTVEGYNEGCARLRLVTDPRDTAQVSFIKGAHFYSSAVDSAGRSDSVRIVVDPFLVFGQETDLQYPASFMSRDRFVLPRHQVDRSKTPCVFSFVRGSIKPGQSCRLVSLLGHVSSDADVKANGLNRLNPQMLAQKRQENARLIDSIQGRMFTTSEYSALDLYFGQTYLDNMLRGGLPLCVSTDGQRRSVYVYSRKHGDLERDYNRFVVEPSFFSQGEGNYRDVNQNRRSDVFFEPSVGEKNIFDFLSLIQLDGYNPLIFKGEKFLVEAESFERCGLSVCFHQKDAGKIAHLMHKPFTLGEIFRYLQENKVRLLVPREELVRKILEAARVAPDAAFGEGYWTDHWTYNTDLLESFRAMYPDRVKGLFFERSDFPFYDAAAFVKPRSERYVLRQGQVRQYHAVVHDEKKTLAIQKREKDKDWVRAEQGQGAVVTTTLVVKLVSLILNKAATLDPCGIGIEMEADKPNWYDALNGLPGLLGSSISETFELKRLIVFLEGVLGEFSIPDDASWSVPEEIARFFSRLTELLERNPDAQEYWDQANTIKEEYRRDVRLGLEGGTRHVGLGSIRHFFSLVKQRLDSGIRKGADESGARYSTYYAYNVSRYETVTDEAGHRVIVPKEFIVHRLPLYLEGFVHALRTQTDQAPGIHAVVRKSPLWDRKLSMYRVNASLAKESFEIGRARAFAPGWLENESIWLHMEYKYILELLRNGLYEEYYQDFFRLLVPFLDAQQYGRSILENSSFIASSAFCDPRLHGTGFVARLSGSTAELIHMWRLMNVGARPFLCDEQGRLQLRFQPALSARLFLKKPVSRTYTDLNGRLRTISFKEDSYAFVFLGRTLVVYSNPSRKDTFGKHGVRPVRISLFDGDGMARQFGSDTVGPPYAEKVRDGGFDRIEILLGS